MQGLYDVLHESHGQVLQDGVACCTVWTKHCSCQSSKLTSFAVLVATLICTYLCASKCPGTCLEVGQDTVNNSVNILLQHVGFSFLTAGSWVSKQLAAKCTDMGAFFGESQIWLHRA